jgi:hypothetical protein
MNFMIANQRGFFQTVLVTCTLSAIVFGFSNKQVKATSTIQPEQLMAVACSAGDLSRSSPPFRCLTPAMFRCLKRNNAASGGSLEYRGNTSGDIVVKSNVAGAVALLGFRFDESTQTLNLNVKKKNLPVRDQQIWDGFRGTIAKCRQNPNYPN